MNVAFIFNFNTFNNDHEDLHFHTSFKQNAQLMITHV
jgi:hypothetical protein